VDGKFTPLGSV